ncbi:MAG: hypothetical protein KAS72_02170 [Phycisphaerales bacterium]|nr:hypothetical protein [Phycisphaerales bacterium]
MSMKIEFARVLGGAGLVALLAGSALAELPNTTDQEIAALEAQLTAKHAQKAQEVQTHQMSLLVDQAVSDAAERSFYLDGPATIGYTPGKGFTISDRAGDNTLNISFLSQFRYNVNIQNDTPGNAAGNVDGTSAGFEFHRNQFAVTGKLQGKYDYTFRADFGPTGVFTLLDMFIAYEWEPGLTFIAGQMDVPFMHETLVGDGMQLAVDRSTVETLFGAGRTQGIAVKWAPDDYFTFTGAFTDGVGGANTDWNSDPNELAVTGRVDWVFAGDPSQFGDFTANRSQDQGGKIGGAVHYQDGDVGDGATFTSFIGPSPNVFAWTVDAQIEWPGASLYAAVVGNTITPETPGGVETDNFGYMAQGGYYLTEDWEIFGRWEYLDIDGLTDDPMIVTFGANYYMDGHINKCTFDCGIATENIPIGIANDTSVLEVDAAGEDTQFFARAQWQLIF